MALNHWIKVDKECQDELILLPYGRLHSIIFHFIFFFQCILTAILYLLKSWNSVKPSYFFGCKLDRNTTFETILIWYCKIDVFINIASGSNKNSCEHSCDHFQANTLPLGDLLEVIGGCKKLQEIASFGRLVGSRLKYSWRHAKVILNFSFLSINHLKMYIHVYSLPLISSAVSLLFIYTWYLWYLSQERVLNHVTNRNILIRDWTQLSYKIFPIHFQSQTVLRCSSLSVKKHF